MDWDAFFMTWERIVLAGTSIWAILASAGWAFTRLKLTRKLRELRKDHEKRFELLEGRLSDRHQVVVYTGEPSQEKPTAYDPSDGRMYFGTKYGDLRIRFHNAESIVDDIRAWLVLNDLNSSVTMDAVKAILLRREQLNRE